MVEAAVSVKQTYPIIFGRKGGSALSKLAQLNSTKVVSQLKVLFSIEEKLEHIKSELVEKLEQEIQRTQGENKKLFNLKRDVFNGRSLEKYNSIHFLDETIALLLKDIKSTKEQFESILKSLEAIFHSELKAAFVELGTMSNSPFFKNGLLFSSQVLYKEIVKGNFNEGTLNKKSKRFYISILKYLTRSLTKTTPFSSFNNIFYLEKEKEGYRAQEGTLQSYFSINNLLFHYAKEALLSHKEFRKELCVKVNETLWENENSELHFYVNQNNNEFFKKLPNSDLIAFIKEKTQSSKVKYKDLVKAISEILSDEVAKIENFVEVLIREGFLMLSFPVSYYSKTWAKELDDFIQENDLTKDFLTFGTKLNLVFEASLSLPSLSTLERQNLIKFTHQEVSEFLTKLHNETKFLEKVSPQDLFYEDTVTQIEDSISEENYDFIKGCLKEAYKELNSVSYKDQVKQSLSEVLKDDFECKMPLLKFHETVYLNPKYSQIFHRATVEPIKAIIDQIQLSRLVNREIENIDLKEMTKDSKNQTLSKPFGAYIQAIESDFSQVVLNEFSKGNGANASRFFNFCPEEQLEKVKKLNSEKEYIIADVKDASLHNTNLFPPLSKYVISLSHNNILNDQFDELKLKDLFVTTDKEEGIVLTNGEGTKVVPIQFSLEGSHGKSKLTHLLDLFDPNENFGYRMLLESINALYKNDLKEKDIVFIPRFSYGNEIIIQRKKWLINKRELVGVVGKTTSLTDLFFKLNKWKSSHAIPDRVFLKIKGKDRSSGDHYKPQYIDFSSPVFVLLLQNILSKADDVIELTEMLPGSKDVIEQGGYVKEYLITVA